MCLGSKNKLLRELADKATELVQSGEFSERSACNHVVKDTECKSESVRKILQRDAKPKEKAHGNRLLSDLEELTLIGILHAYAQRGMGLQHKDTIDLVRREKELKNDWDGDSWARGFFERNAAIISKRVGKKTEEERINKVSKKNMMDFADQVEDLLSEVSFQAKFVINADESPVAPMNPTFAPVASSPMAPKVNQLRWNKDDLRTVVPFLGADGTVWMVVLIFARVHGSENADSKPITIVQNRQKTAKSWPIYYASTKSGYMNKELWSEVIKEFVAILQPQLGGASALLFLDHLSSHEQIPALSLLLKNNIHPIFFPPHASHILQPADNVVFASLKRAVLSESLNLYRDYLKAGKTSNTIVQEVILIALKKALTGDAIRASFANTAMFPWNRAKFTELVQKYVLDAPTPVKSKELPRPVIDAKNIVLKDLAQITLPQKIRCRGIQRANQLVRGEDILAFKVKQDEEKKRLEEEQRIKKELASEKKRKREEQKQQQEASRIRCLICSTVFRGGAAWWRCRVCHEILLCGGCASSPHATAHEAECTGE